MLLPRERPRVSSGLGAAVSWALERFMDVERAWWALNGTIGIWVDVSTHQSLVLNEPETPLGKLVKNRLLDFPPRNSEPGDLDGAQETVFLRHAQGMPMLPSRHLTNLRTSDGILCTR